MSVPNFVLIGFLAVAAVSHLVSSYKVVCYYPNWAYWRKGIGKLAVEDVDPALCTHIVYSFVVLDEKTYKLKPHDDYLDVGLKYYQKFTALKQQNSKLKVLLALGGWNDSRGNKYSILVSDPTKRATFITHAKKFIKIFNFDGLDLDWEYPGVSDTAGFSAWVKELHDAFAPEGLEVTAAVSASTDKGYDVPVMSKYLDAIHLMEYDMHGSWEASTVNHHAPLYATGLSVDASVKSWISKGADPKKLVLGIPTYGRSWKLTTNNVTPPAPAQGAAPAGPYTGEAGTMAYYEICFKINNEGWTKEADPTHKMGPWAYKLPNWVGYDDPAMAKIKTEYIKSKGLGGAMFWDLAMDDFNNICGHGKNPIISTVVNTICGGGANCESTSVPSGTVKPPSPGLTTPATSTTTIHAQPPDPGFTCPSDGLFPDPSNCAMYYHCWKGVANNKSCPSGLLFNPASSTCDWPQFVKCGRTTGDDSISSQEQ